MTQISWESLSWRDQRGVDLRHPRNLRLIALTYSNPALAKTRDKKIPPE